MIKGANFAWTRGSSMDVPLCPKTLAAYRPEDFKSLAKVKKECMAGLPESHRLSIPEKVSSASDAKLVSLQTWIDWTKKATKAKGWTQSFVWSRMGGIPPVKEFGHVDVT